ncbi:hypothetical protein KJ751_03730 [Patescibacteria group bacterium]|nr:hypothetical protein [Patescibacteria group bacterium]
MDEQKFEPKITPEQEREQLSGQITRTPEKAREIMGKHFEKKPSDIYLPEYDISPGQFSEIEKKIVDIGYEEKDRIMKELFSIAETKGVLNAFNVARKLTPSLLDDFHDQLVAGWH